MTIFKQVEPMSANVRRALRFCCYAIKQRGYKSGAALILKRLRHLHCLFFCAVIRLDAVQFLVQALQFLTLRLLGLGAGNGHHAGIFTHAH